MTGNQSREFHAAAKISTPPLPAPRGRRANALDHGTEAVRALRSEVLAQAQALEQGDRVGRENFAGVLAGKHREQDGDETAHDMGIAVAGEGEHRPAWPSERTVVASQTWLAQPCTLFASLRSRSDNGARPRPSSMT